MELSETWLQTFEKEGFISVYEWSDPAGIEYKEHAHKGKVSLFVTDGSIIFNFSGETQEVVVGTRLNIEPGQLHSAVVGPNGWHVVVGEEIDGDS